MIEVTRPALAAGVLATLALAPAPSGAQVRASERATVSQTVDGTVMTLDYSRPRSRGREDLFGGEVKWNEVWTPGANEATVLELNHDVRIEGHPVPAGRWSVWMVVAESGPWELVLDPRDTLFHTAHPEPTDEQIRFPVARGEGEFVDVLTWSFPSLRNDGATMQMAWGDARVALDVTVEPSRVLTVEPAAARPYLGDWTIAFLGPPGADAPEPEPQPLRIERQADGRLVGTTTPPPWSRDGEPLQILLLPVAEGVLEVGFMQHGELVEMGGAFMEFEFDGTRPVSFKVRWGDGDDVFASGERVG